MTVATTILEQLGGRRFRMMTGAGNFVAIADGNGLMFTIGRNSHNVNKVRIRLTAADDYTVETWRIRGTKATPVETREGVYCDNLQDVFTSMTGLYTRL